MRELASNKCQMSHMSMIVFVLPLSGDLLVVSNKCQIPVKSLTD